MMLSLSSVRYVQSCYFSTTWNVFEHLIKFKLWIDRYWHVWRPSVSDHRVHSEILIYPAMLYRRVCLRVHRCPLRAWKTLNGSQDYQPCSGSQGEFSHTTMLSCHSQFFRRCISLNYCRSCSKTALQITHAHFIVLWIHKRIRSRSKQYPFPLRWTINCRDTWLVFFLLLLLTRRH